MRATFIMLLLVSVSLSHAQTPGQQKALNNYADFANHSADEVAAVVMSVIQYYPSLQSKSSGGRRYTCPIQLEDYYHKTALAESKVLPAAVATGLSKRLNDLHGAGEKVDEKCKALDTYHKLEDYKKDNYAQARKIIDDLQNAVRDYRTKQDALAVELEAAFKKINPTAEQGNYGKADAMLKKEIARERAFLDNWTFNLNESVPTGWPAEKLQQSIAETADGLATLKKQQPALKYPASSMWSNFQESLSSVLEAKRNAQDEYNHEAKKSDRHGNDTYLGLINYFNGTLVADQNTFIQYASNDGYPGLKAIKYFPMFEIRSEVVAQAVTVKPFADYPRTPLRPVAQKVSLQVPTYSAIVNYVGFINETWRQVERLAQALHNLGGDVGRYDKVDSYGRHGRMSFDYKDFQLPQSQYQKTIAESHLLPPDYARALNQQAEVLLNILKELDAISAKLEGEVSDAQYDAGRSARVNTWLQRATLLLKTWDDRKELLYNDVRVVFEAFPPVSTTSSWYVSGRALQQLTDLDRDALFKARAFYLNGQKGTPPTISTDAIDAALREVISKEYQNMKGIEKYGRNNGLCPYTPYEDIPEISKTLSEKLNPLATGKGSGYQHPYERVLYHYNDIVRHYNKFCELSKKDFLLPTIYQPKMYQRDEPVLSPPPSTPPVTASATASVSASGSNSVTGSSEAGSKTESPKTNQAPVATAATPANAEIQRPAVTQTVRHDTIYIERRDTVYLSGAGENLRSMEGYAVNHIVLLLDVSGSMNAPEKLPILKASVLELVSMMRPEDKVSIVAFSDKPRAVLTSASFKDEQRIRQAISNLKSSGKTDGNAAVKLAYKVADENYIRGGNNRIILATDGEFGLNDVSRELISRFSNEDIFLSVFNFGKGAGASRTLEQVANLGKGNYQYISRENVELQLIREVKSKRAR